MVGMISKQNRWAVLALVALGGVAGRMTADGVAKEIGASSSYVEKMLLAFRSAGWVNALRGPGGGYYRLVPLSTLSMADVESAMEKLNTGKQMEVGGELAKVNSAMSRVADEFSRKLMLSALADEDKLLTVSESDKA